MDEADRAALSRIAWQSIRHGLAHAAPLDTTDLAVAAALAAPGACFVTLQRHGALRGCIGSLAAERPLAADTAHNAFAAAFRDPRFAPLDTGELRGLAVSLSVLSAPEPLAIATEDELLQALRPGVDGLILSDTRHRGTFLPSVWQSLPEPRAFVRELKRKAGLAEEYWSPDLQIERYTTESWPALE